MSVVYVVMGSTGEYSDQREWPVRAFENKERAQAEVTLLAEFARIYETKKASEDDFFDIQYDKAKFAAWKLEHVPGLDAADPSFDMDYTGTRYFVYEVPWGRP